MPWTIPNLLLHDKPVPLANMRSLGRTRVFVYCSNPDCHHNAEIDASGFPDDMTFGDLQPPDALSSSGGKLSITWDVTTAPGEGQVFTLNWTETRGPEVQPPTRRGFGMQAIERLLAQEIDGKAIVAFAPEGLRCSIEAPFTEKLGAETEARVFVQR